MRIAGTGHRPEDCPYGESVVRSVSRIKLENALVDNEIEVCITGMAAGFDLWYADEAIGLGIPVIAARPWAGHTPRKEDEELYAKVVEAAIEVVNVNESEKYPGAWVYHNRNKWMVDNATHLLAYWSGKEDGGTYACMKYAWAQKEKGIDLKIYNLINDPPFNVGSKVPHNKEL